MARNRVIPARSRQKNSLTRTPRATCHRNRAVIPQKVTLEKARLESLRRVLLSQSRMIPLNLSQTTPQKKQVEKMAVTPLRMMAGLANSLLTYRQQSPNLACLIRMVAAMPAQSRVTIRKVRTLTLVNRAKAVVQKKARAEVIRNRTRRATITSPGSLVRETQTEREQTVQKQHRLMVLRRSSHRPRTQARAGPVAIRRDSHQKKEHHNLRQKAAANLVPIRLQANLISLRQVNPATVRPATNRERNQARKVPTRMRMGIRNQVTTKVASLVEKIRLTNPVENREAKNQAKGTLVEVSHKPVNPAAVRAASRAVIRDKAQAVSDPTMARILVEMRQFGRMIMPIRMQLLSGGVRGRICMTRTCRMLTRPTLKTN